MDDERLFRLAEKFMALGREFLEIVKDYELENSAEDDDLDIELEEECENEIPPCH